MKVIKLTVLNIAQMGMPDIKNIEQLIKENGFEINGHKYFNMNEVVMLKYNGSLYYKL
jgi:hypothetical protein